MGPRIASLMGLLFGALAPMPVANAMELLVPAYFYPAAGGSDWDRLAAAAKSGIAVTAIMNPASGPGGAAIADYARAIGALHAGGGRVLGYVPSGYIGRAVNPTSSCRPANGHAYTPADIVACAARYQSFYAIDGIFVDEMGPPKSGAPVAELVAYYTQVYDGLKAVNRSWTIFGNPGTTAPEGLLRQGRAGGANVLVTFENRAVLYAATAPAAYARQYPQHRFASILIETAPHFDFGNTLQLAGKRNFGYLYVTDRARPNPYDRLPTDWDGQLAAMRHFNGAPNVPGRR